MTPRTLADFKGLCTELAEAGALVLEKGTIVLKQFISDLDDSTQ